MKHIYLGVAIALLASTDAGAQRYVKELVFPEGADSITKIEMAGRLVPNEQQKAWQERELTAFIHFGMNTFTDREWGDGTESPSTFNPTDLDTDQWVKALKDAGFKMVILTAKHHDGFCLWPTATTEHSVKNSPWRDGKGDVVADLRKSCDKYDMKLGLYLSPWDRNAECYGDSPRYNDMFVAQLTELLSNYGKVDEVWFDGACAEGPNGKKQEYDWVRFRDTMRKLQPEAVLAITGDDVRWVGNEGGKGRETEWSVTTLVPKTFAGADSINAVMGLNEMSPDLGSRAKIAQADRIFWWPAEVDVSIRPGWFYHETEEPHALSKMAQIYVESVGRNAVLLLNIPPDRRGRIADKDVARLMELRRWIDGNFSDNLLGRKGGKINAVVLSENINDGQRIEAFDVEALVDGSWQKVASGTTIGKKRILQFPDVVCDDVRIVVTQSRGESDSKVEGAYYVVMPSESVVAGSRYKIYDQAYKLTQVTAGGKNQKYMYEFNEPTELAGFVYTPTVKGESTPMMYHYTVMASDNGRDWQTVILNGEFGNIQANPIPQEVVFEKPVRASYIFIMCNETVGNGKFIPNESEIKFFIR